VQLLTEVPERFEPGAELQLGPDGVRRVVVRSTRRHHGRLLIRFEGVEDRDAADALRGLLLLADAASSPAPPEGGFWVHQVVGLEVETEAGRSLGRVREVLHSPANDVWVVEGAGREVLIPALKDVVARVDLDARTAVVREVAGLFEEG